MSKTLDEVIEKILINIILEDAVDARLVKEISKFTAAEILRFCEERCGDHVRHSEGRLVNHDNPDEAWGEQMSANDLLEYLRA